MKYGLKKFAAMLITILCISFLVYLAFDVIPGDAALAALGTDVEPARLEALREEMGLNRNTKLAVRKKEERMTPQRERKWGEIQHSNERDRHHLGESSFREKDGKTDLYLLCHTHTHTHEGIGLWLRHEALA